MLFRSGYHVSSFSAEVQTNLSHSSDKLPDAADGKDEGSSSKSSVPPQFQVCLAEFRCESYGPYLSVGLSVL